MSSPGRAAIKSLGRRLDSYADLLECNIPAYGDISVVMQLDCLGVARWLFLHGEAIRDKAPIRVSPS